MEINQHKELGVVDSWLPRKDQIDPAVRAKVRELSHQSPNMPQRKWPRQYSIPVSWTLRRGPVCCDIIGGALWSGLSNRERPESSGSAGKKL